MGLLTQAEAAKDAREHRAKVFAEGGPRMAIVLTTDDQGVPTHEYCPESAVQMLYGPQIKAEIARVVEVLP
jgi:hypothetical protein